MKVLLIKSVEDLGIGGQVLDVADGYAMNYLLPKKLAVKATPGAVCNAEQYRRKALAVQAQIVSEAEKMVEKVNGHVCRIIASSDDSGHLYGSITERQISDALSAAGFQIDPGHILLTEHIKTIGDFNVPVKIYGDLKACVTVSVTQGEPR
jgi:large subunit ribosomal protein L9